MDDIFLMLYISKNGLPCGARGKERTCQWRRRKRRGFDPWVGKIPGIGNGNPIQYSCLENSIDREVWWAIVHRLAKSQTRLKRLYKHTRRHTHTYQKISLLLPKSSFRMEIVFCQHFEGISVLYSCFQSQVWRHSDAWSIVLAHFIYFYFGKLVIYSFCLQCWEIAWGYAFALVGVSSSTCCIKH